MYGKLRQSNWVAVVGEHLIQSDVLFYQIITLNTAFLLQYEMYRVEIKPQDSLIFKKLIMLKLKNLEQRYWA